MASTLKMEYQVFLCIFQKNSAMATLGLKEMGKFLWEGREKGLPCWLSQFSRIVPFPSNLRQPQQSSFGKCKKVWYYEKWVGPHASFPPRRSVKYSNQKRLDKIFSPLVSYQTNQAKHACKRRFLDEKTHVKSEGWNICYLHYLVCTTTYICRACVRNLNLRVQSVSP